MAENPDVVGGVRIRRARSRVESLKIDKEKLAARYAEFYQKDNEDRSDDINARIQRYAKYRMWRENKDWPWADATNAALPDMATACMRLEDTLHNAVMSSRPPIQAKARQEAIKDREERVTELIDHQFFNEQPGEETVGSLAHDFVTEGFATAYTPWIHETRRVRQVKVHPPIPEGMRPPDYFLPLIQGTFPRAEITPAGEGWDFKIVTGEKRAKVSFYTKPDGRIEMEMERDIDRFNGPRCIRKDLQDILHPARCENLQIPGPSNPTGASHVIMRDYPTVDEIKRLATKDEDGIVYYDLLDDKGRDKLKIARMDESYQDREKQKDVLQGHQEQTQAKGTQSHQPLTRLMCFDCFDVDDDGLDEDIVVTMILETKTILRIRYLSEVFPSETPRRPFAEGHLFPVPGRRLSIGMLELMEGVHDLMKQFFDQGGDAGTIANAPFFFYRAASNMKPEVIKLWPGEGYPLNDPQRDVHFPTIGNQGQSFMFNMLSLLTQWEEKLTTIGDLQVGRVPQGKASALRTVAGMQTVLAQGDARPERVLRRFFMLLTQVFENFHALNELLLPERKQYMLTGPNVDPRKKVYGEASVDSIRGSYLFTFDANVLNTSKEALQGALERCMGVVIQPLNIQLGITGPEEIYRLQRDYIKSLGPNPDKYLRAPSPGASDPPINAEDAIYLIMQGVMPKGSPMEGAAEHFEKLMFFAQSDEFGHLGPEHIPLFRAYLEQARQMMAQEQAQQALLQAAGKMGQSMGGPKQQPGPEGAGAVDQSMPMLQNNELADESLPGAGGGGNPGVMA